MRRKIILLSSICIIILIILGLLFYINDKYTVRTVYVEGNVHYTDQEIMDIVMAGKYGYSSIYLSIKYKNKGVEDIPFVQTMDVTILSPDTIKITVYEKALAGYIEYLDRYMYFDKDGIVVESSDEITEGIPQVLGLQFDSVVMYEALPVDDETVFNEILDITQLMSKYNVTADKIYFDADKKITLYFENVRVSIGENTNLDEKIMKLQYLLPELVGKSGVLHMENYSEDTNNITFDVDT